METVALPDPRWPHDGDMMLEPGAVTNLHIRANDAVGADTDFSPKAGGRIDDGSGMDEHEEKTAD